MAVDPLLQLVCRPAGRVDLAHAALLVARDAYPDLDPETALAQIKALAAPLAGPVAQAPDAAARLHLVSQRLFTELGFRGNGEEYYDPRNSYLNEVIQRRLGIPITLSILYIAVGRRLGLQLTGVNFPMHFLVRCDDEPQPLFVDAFDGGAIVGRPALQKRLTQTLQRPTELEDRFLQPASPRQVLARLLRNLRQIHIQRQELRQAARLGQRVVALQPHEPQDHRDLGLLYYRLGAYQRSIAAFEQCLKLPGSAQERAATRRQMQTLFDRLGALN